MDSPPSVPPMKTETIEASSGHRYPDLFVPLQFHERDLLDDRSQAPEPEERIMRTNEVPALRDNQATANHVAGPNEAVREHSVDFEITGERDILKELQEEFYKAAKAIANNAKKGSALTVHLHGMAALAKLGDKDVFIACAKVWKDDLRRAGNEAEARLNMVDDHLSDYKKSNQTELSREFTLTVKRATKLLRSDERNIARCKEIIDRIVGA